MLSSMGGNAVSGNSMNIGDPGAYLVWCPSLASAYINVVFQQILQICRRPGALTSPLRVENATRGSFTSKNREIPDWQLL